MSFKIVPTVKYFNTINKSFNNVIYITNPRQIITKENALYCKKLADINEEVGFSYKDSIGPSGNNLKFITDGLLISYIQGGKLDSKCRAIIIDEAHERNIQIDFLLFYIKKMILDGSNIKLIIMSATIDTTIFSTYFPRDDFGEIEISGQPNKRIHVHFNTTDQTKYIKHERNFITNKLDKTIANSKIMKNVILDKIVELLNLKCNYCNETHNFIDNEYYFKYIKTSDDIYIQQIDTTNSACDKYFQLNKDSSIEQITELLTFLQTNKIMKNSTTEIIINDLYMIDEEHMLINCDKFLDSLQSKYNEN